MSGEVAVPEPSHSGGTPTGDREAEEREALDQRLATERNVWLASPRADGSSHVTPVWFVWDGRAFWICTSTGNAKASNLRRDPRLSLALEDGDRPLVAEGSAVLHSRPFPLDVVERFRAKFDWDIRKTDAVEGDFGLLLEVVPTRWILRVP